MPLDYENLFERCLTCLMQAEVTDYIGRSEGKDLVRISVTVETESQRAIMIGKGGAALKQLSTASRRGIEEFLGEQPYLIQVVSPLRSLSVILLELRF